MRTVKLVSSFIFFVATMLLLAQTRTLAASGKQDKTSRPDPPTQGERAFRQNCSRCHSAPESFPPQISGTIVRHMRVRANLSPDDERAILKFLNP